MLKENILKGLYKSKELMNQNKEKLPLGMRGELEVIVRDSAGNVTSYQKGHNTVTDWTKMQIIHMLAGEIFTLDDPLFSNSRNSSENLFTRTAGSEGYKIPQRSNSDSETHSSTINKDGYLLSGEPYFYSYNENEIIQTNGMTGYNNFNSPTKMLFGTGMEASDLASAKSEYTSETKDEVSNILIASANGFDEVTNLEGKMFNKNLTSNENFYTSDINNNKTRTLQPLTVNAQAGDPSPTSTSIKGAIKNDNIYNQNDLGEYYISNTINPEVKGTGLPAFINTKRSNETFYLGNSPKSTVNISVNPDNTSNTGVNRFEDKITYSVVMPNTKGNYYPYTNWILKEAGLFCDSRFLLRSEGGEVENFTKMPCGILMFKRNITPVVKAEDSEIEFRWSIVVSS